MEPIRCPLVALFVCLLTLPLFAQAQNTVKPKSRVVVVGVNGMELDVIRPLLVKGELPNLAKVIKNGAYGKLRTVSAPNCPRVYSTMFTSTKPEEHGVTGFIVGGITANTNMLKEEPMRRFTRHTLPSAIDPAAETYLLFYFRPEKTFSAAVSCLKAKASPRGSFARGTSGRPRPISV